MIMVNKKIICDDLIQRYGQCKTDREILKLRVLNLHLPTGSGKIEKIENLQRLSGLEILDLSYNRVKTVENLSNLKNLKVLNLQENCIEFFSTQCFNNLNNLEQINLNGNSIEKLPSSFKHLKSLRVLRLARNKVKNFDDIKVLKDLDSLSSLNLEGNPISTSLHYREYLIYNLVSLDVLDGMEVSLLDRKQANERYERKTVEALENEIKTFQEKCIKLESENAAIVQQRESFERQFEELKRNNKELMIENKQQSINIATKTKLLERANDVNMIASNQMYEAKLFNYAKHQDIDHQRENMIDEACLLEISSIKQGLSEIRGMENGIETRSDRLDKRLQVANEQLENANIKWQQLCSTIQDQKDELNYGEEDLFENNIAMRTLSLRIKEKYSELEKQDTTRKMNERILSELTILYSAMVREILKTLEQPQTMEQGLALLKYWKIQLEDNISEVKGLKENVEMERFQVLEKRDDLKQKVGKLLEEPWIGSYRQPLEVIFNKLTVSFNPIDEKTQTLMKPIKQITDTTNQEEEIVTSEQNLEQYVTKLDAEYKYKHSILESEISNLENMVQHLKLVESKHLKTIENLKKENVKMQKENDIIPLQNLVEEWQVKAKTKEVENQNLKSRVGELSQQLANVQMEIHEMKTFVLSELNGNSDPSLLEEKVKKLKSMPFFDSLKQFIKAIQDAKENLNSIQNRIAKALEREESIQKCMISLESIKSDLLDSENRAHQAGSRATVEEAKLQSLKIETEKAEEKLEKTERELLLTQGKLCSLKKQLGKVQHLMEEKKCEFEVETTQKETLDTELSALMSKKRILEKQFNELKTKMDEISSGIETKKSELNRLDETKMQTIQQIGSRELQLQDLHEKIEQASAQLKTIQSKFLQKTNNRELQVLKMETLQNQIQIQEQVKIDLENRSKILENNVAEFETKLTNLKRDYNHYEQLKTQHPVYASVEEARGALLKIQEQIFACEQKLKVKEAYVNQATEKETDHAINELEAAYMHGLEKIQNAFQEKEQRLLQAIDEARVELRIEQREHLKQLKALGEKSSTKQLQEIAKSLQEGVSELYSQKELQKKYKRVWEHLVQKDTQISFLEARVSVLEKEKQAIQVKYKNDIKILEQIYNI